MTKKLRNFLLLLTVICMALGISVFAAACDTKEEPPAAVDAMSIRYDGEVFTWDEVPGASVYDLTINNTMNFKSYASAAYSFSADSLLGQDVTAITLSITASNNAGAGPTVSKTFTRLQTISISSVTFSDDGEMSWPGVTGASSYQVKLTVDGTNTVKDVPGTTFSDFEYGNDNEVQIKPIGGGDTFSSWSDSIKAYFLATPTSIEYDGEYISWKGTTKAKSYTVYINGSEEANVKELRYRYEAQEEDFDIQVRAEGDLETSTGATRTFPSKVSDKVSIVFLGEVQNIRVEDGCLTWDRNDKAVSYTVNIKGETPHKVEECRYPLPAGVTVTASVTPNGADPKHTFARTSAEQSYTILAAPVPQWNEGIALDDGQPNRNFTWNMDSYANVSGFLVKVVMPSGEEDPKDATVDNRSLHYGFEEVGIYTVSVKAVASAGSNVYDSAYSTEFVIERLPAPNLAATPVTSTNDDLDAGFVIHFSSVTGASGYRVYRNDQKVQDIGEPYASSVNVTNVTEETTTTAQTIVYKLQSVGKVTTREGKKYITLNSLTSEMRDVTVTVLPMPQNLDIQGPLLSWSDVTSANGYAVEVAARTVCKETEYSLESLSEGEHTVRVCAQGDGHALLPSPYTKSFTVEKLKAPTDVKVNTDNDEGRLEFSKSLLADHYEYSFTGHQGYLTDSQVGSINSYIQTDTAVVTIRAVADYWKDNVNKDLYYLSSSWSRAFSFTKLAAPTFGNPAFTNTELRWNAPVNAQGVTVTYKVTDQRGLTVPQILTATRLDFSVYEAGDYSFTVRAIGDGERFINSDPSSVVAITKLATPQVDRSGNSYHWDIVDGASEFSVWIEGKNVETIKVNTNQPQQTYDYAPVFSKPGVNQVEIIAVGDAGHSTVDSKPCHINQEVKQLTTPVLDKPEYSGVDTGDTITVKISKGVDLAVGYRILINGVVRENCTKELTYTFQPASRGQFTAAVYAVGNVFDDYGTYHLDSEKVGDTTQTTIILLSAPTVDNIDVDTYGQISWGKVDYADHFEVEVTFTNGEKWTGKTSDNTMKIKPDYSAHNSSAGEISTIKIRAMGNNRTTYDSPWVEQERR